MRLIGESGGMREYFHDSSSVLLPSSGSLDLGCFLRLEDSTASLLLMTRDVEPSQHSFCTTRYETESACLSSSRSGRNALLLASTHSYASHLL